MPILINNMETDSRKQPNLPKTIIFELTGLVIENKSKLKQLNKK